MPTPTPTEAIVATMRDAANTLEAAAARAAATPAQHIVAGDKMLPAPVPPHLRVHFEMLAEKGLRRKAASQPPAPFLDLSAVRAILAGRGR